mmetsp:Transcript_10037/g.22348  ORF Transcript_10037/g.22348 Transcript_10037/m.22348 type:complete len:262 (-) Transcript_10037:113-898(-)
MALGIDLVLLHGKFVPVVPHRLGPKAILSQPFKRRRLWIIVVLCIILPQLFLIVIIIFHGHLSQRAGDVHLLPTLGANHVRLVHGLHGKLRLVNHGVGAVQSRGSMITIRTHHHGVVSVGRCRFEKFSQHSILALFFVQFQRCVGCNVELWWLLLLLLLLVVVICQGVAHAFSSSSPAAAAVVLVGFFFFTSGSSLTAAQRGSFTAAPGAAIIAIFLVAVCCCVIHTGSASLFLTWTAAANDFHSGATPSIHFLVGRIPRR